MSLSTDEVRYVAELAKLKLTEDEVARFALQLSEILDYAELLKEVDTSQILPTPYVLDLENVTRADIPSDGLNNDQALANAPDKDQGFFRVRAVFSD